MSNERPHSRLYGEFLDLLARHDPMGLVEIGAPNDEYKPEVEWILPRLGEAGSAEDLGRIIHEEFISMFDEELAGPRSQLAGPRSRYHQAAREAWEMIRDSSGLE